MNSSPNKMKFKFPSQHNSSLIKSSNIQSKKLFNEYKDHKPNIEKIQNSTCTLNELENLINYLEKIKSRLDYINNKADQSKNLYQNDLNVLKSMKESAPSTPKPKLKRSNETDIKNSPKKEKLSSPSLEKNKKNIKRNRNKFTGILKDNVGESNKYLAVGKGKPPTQTQLAKNEIDNELPSEPMKKRESFSDPSNKMTSTRPFNTIIYSKEELVKTFNKVGINDIHFNSPIIVPIWSVNTDFTKTKVSINSVAHTTYVNFIEAFFKPMVEEDLEILKENDKIENCFLIPQLGTYYKEKFKRWDGDDNKSWVEKSYFLYESSGKFTDRVLSALLPDKYSKEDFSIEPEDFMDNCSLLNLMKVDNFEVRLVHELKAHNLLNKDVEANVTDEITMEIRKLQSELIVQHEINKKRKKILLKKAKEHLGYQKFWDMIENVDKQLETLISKKGNKGKKKKIVQKNIPDEAMEYVKIRTKALEMMRPLFDKKEFVLPENSIFNS